MAHGGGSESPKSDLRKICERSFIYTYCYSMECESAGLLERLDRGPVIGDGGFRLALEKRGYVNAGEWSPEAVLEHPEAVAQLHREFVRAGSDVCQAFTMSCTDDELRDQSAGRYKVGEINNAALKLATSIAKQAGCLIAGNICETSIYSRSANKEAIKAHVKKLLGVFKDHNVDFMICEYYEHVEEAEWHIEAIREFMPGTPVCASLCINENSDIDGVPTDECGVRLARAGADVVGINCHFGPFRCLSAVKQMIRAVKDAGYDKTHFMVQPLGFLTPDAGPGGFIDLPEYPFALEPRECTRVDMATFAREAYDAGVRFIGGCCGTQPHHIRAMSEELSPERSAPVRSCWAKSLEKHTKPWVRLRAARSYWNNITPATGRPYSAPLSGQDQVCE